MNPSYPYDQDLHEAGSRAAQGLCTHHAEGDEACGREAVVSYEDADGRWQAGCTAALQELVDNGDIEPLGQGA